MPRLHTFEAHRRSLHARGSNEKPCPTASWDSAGNRWVVQLCTLDDLLALGVACDAPIAVLAVGGTDEDLNVLEIRDTEDPDGEVDQLRSRRPS